MNKTKHPFITPLYFFLSESFINCKLRSLRGKVNENALGVLSFPSSNTAFNFTATLQQIHTTTTESQLLMVHSLADLLTVRKQTKFIHIALQLGH